MQKTNKEIVNLFSTLANLFTLRNAKNDFFRVRSSQNTAQIIENMQEPISNFIDLENNKFKTKISGVGKASEDKIIEFITTNKCLELEKLLEIYPQGLLDMMEIKGLGPKKALLMYEKFNVDSITKLKNILNQPDKLAEISVKEKTIANLKEAIENQYTNKKRHPISEIYNEITTLEKTCEQLDGVKGVYIAGSFRRLESTIGDIDIIITCSQNNREKIINQYIKIDSFKKIINSGETKVTAIGKSSIGIDLRLIEEDQIGACLQYFTGNRAHNIKIRQIAKDKKWKINEYGLFDEKEQLIESKNEEKIYNILGLQYIPPTLRTGSEEIDKAKSNKLLYVTKHDIKNSNLNSFTLPSKIYLIPNNNTQSIESTISQVNALGKNEKQLFAFEEKNMELAIQIFQKCNIEKTQILNCLTEKAIHRALEEIKAS